MQRGPYLPSGEGGWEGNPQSSQHIAEVLQVRQKLVGAMGSETAYLLHLLSIQLCSAACNLYSFNKKSLRQVLSYLKMLLSVQCHHKVQHRVGQCCTAQHCTAQQTIAQCRSAQRSTTQRCFALCCFTDSTAQQSAAQHSTAQHTL